MPFDGLPSRVCVRAPVPAWPGQGPPADYVVNVGECTRGGEPNPQLAAWLREARGGNGDFARLPLLQAALARRDVRLLPRFDSLFMRLYAALSAIPLHRDEGRPRVRLVGNSGKARTVKLVLQVYILAPSPERTFVFSIVLPLPTSHTFPSPSA